MNGNTQLEVTACDFKQEPKPRAQTRSGLLGVARGMGRGTRENAVRETRSGLPGGRGGGGWTEGRRGAENAKRFALGTRGRG